MNKISHNFINPIFFTCIHSNRLWALTSGSKLVSPTQCNDTSLHSYLPLLRLCPITSSNHLTSVSVPSRSLVPSPCYCSIIARLKRTTSNSQNPDSFSINRGFNPASNPNDSSSRFFTFHLVPCSQARTLIPYLRSLTTSRLMLEL